AVSVLLSRRLGGGIVLHRDLRLRRPSRAGVRDQSRHRTAADQHPARRGGRCTGRTRVCPAGGSAPLRRDDRPPGGRTLLGRVRPDDGVAGGARPLVLRARVGVLAARGRPPTVRGRDHGAHLLRAVARDRGAPLSRVRAPCDAAGLSTRRHRARVLAASALGRVRPSMQPFALLVVYLASVVVVSALSAPWLYLGFQAAASHPALAWLREVDFQAVLDYLLIGSAILGAVILLASQRALSLRTVGLQASRKALRHLAFGALVASLSVAVLLPLGLASGVFSWDTRLTVGRIVSVGALAIVGASLLALVEEFLFRGCLLGWLSGRAPRLAALLTITALFAICHFLNGGRSPGIDEITWLSGFRMLGHYASRLAADARWVPQLLMLLLVGLTLGWSRLLTSTLYLSIGLHAGWVFTARMVFLVTDIHRDHGNWWFGPGRFIGSPFWIDAVGAVLVIVVLVGKRLRAGTTREAVSAVRAPNAVTISAIQS